MLYPWSFCVALLMDLFVHVCFVFDSTCELFSETFRNIFGCGCYFVIECYGSVECGWRYSVVCVCCACDPSMHIDVPSIGFIGLVAFQSMFISIRVSRLEIAELPDSVHRAAP